MHIIIDFAIVYGNIFLSFGLLNQIGILENAEYNIEAFKVTAPYIGILFFIIVYTFGLYDNINQKDFLETVYMVFLVSISTMIGIMGICFFVRDVAWAFPRSVLLLSSLLNFILLTSCRFIYWKSAQKSKKKKVIIIGNDGENLIKVLTEKYSNYYQIEHQCPNYDAPLQSKIRSVDEVFICPDVLPDTREKILPFCFKHKKEVFFIPGYFDVSIMSASFCKTDDIPTFRLPNTEFSLEIRFAKRLVDLLFASVAAIIALPISLLIALLIKLDGGPVFYVQERLTRGGIVFNILKFRTMIPNAEQYSGPILAENKDARITKIGKFMRATRLDEIPQLINILKGEMSIVGPRPERPFFAEQFEKEIPAYCYRFNVKAGLTGLAQIEGKYNTSVKDKLRYDLIYISKYSLMKDFLIMLKTVKILFIKSSTEGVG